MSERIKCALRAILIFQALGLASCTSIAIGNSDAPAPVVTSANLQSEEPNPFVLSIDDEMNDGEDLHVRGKVKALTNWNPARVWLRLSTLQNGEEIEERHVSLGSLRSSEKKKEAIQMVAPGDELQFQLSVPARNMTDYQLELLWGAEAASLNEEATKKVEERIVSRTVEIRNFAVERIQKPCSEQECPIYFRLLGNLVNLGQSRVEELALAVGFVWVPKGQRLDLSRHIPENEEVINLTDLKLEAGASRPFKLLLDRPVPAESKDGGFRPVIRVKPAAAGSTQ